MQNKSILIIDDNEEIRETYKEFFELEGFRVLVAENGLKGLEVVHRNERIGLIFVDLLMPIMGGVDFIEKCKNNPFYDYIPIYIMTAYSEQTHLNEETAKLFRGVLDKPVQLPTLLEIARSYCN
jgi:CheY-like chemotaxis protein